MQIQAAHRQKAGAPQRLAYLRPPLPAYARRHKRPRPYRVRVAARAVHRLSPAQPQRQPVVRAAPAQPHERRPLLIPKLIPRAHKDAARAVRGYQIHIAVPVQIPLSQPLAVFVIRGVYALRRAVKRGVRRIQQPVIHPLDIQQPRLNRDVLKLPLPVAAQHPPGGGKYHPVRRFPAP